VSQAPHQSQTTLTVSKCGGVHHHLRNGMLAIAAHVAFLGEKLPPELLHNLHAIKQQILRMEQALADCSTPNDTVTP
jgi:hypothetical protein